MPFVIEVIFGILIVTNIISAWNGKNFYVALLCLINSAVMIGGLMAFYNNLY